MLISETISFWRFLVCACVCISARCLDSASLCFDEALNIFWQYQQARTPQKISRERKIIFYMLHWTSSPSQKEIIFSPSFFSGINRFVVCQLVGIMGQLSIDFRPVCIASQKRNCHPHVAHSRGTDINGNELRINFNQFPNNIGITNTQTHGIGNERAMGLAEQWRF